MTTPRRNRDETGKHAGVIFDLADCTVKDQERMTKYPSKYPMEQLNQMGMHISCVKIKIAGQKLKAALDSATNYNSV